MSQNYICFNNKFYPEEHAVFSMNRAMKYGDGLFESIRIINGVPQLLDLHLKRLQAGADLLKIDLSISKINEIKVCLTQLLIRNEIEKGGYLRLTVYRGGKGKYLSDSNEAEYVLEASPLTSNTYQLNSKGLLVDISINIRIQPSGLSAAKTLNALSYIIAAEEAKERRLNDVLLLNTSGDLTESSSSNLFLVMGNEVITPPLQSGCLQGVMRKNIISKLKINGYHFTEKSISPEMLEIADEIFLSNSISGIQWVGAFKKTRYFNRISKQIFSLLS